MSGLLFRTQFSWPARLRPSAARHTPARPVNEIVDGALLRDDIAGCLNSSEVDVVRHFHAAFYLELSHDLGLYPLDPAREVQPKVNEVVSRLQGFAHVHPCMPASWSRERYAFSPHWNPVWRKSAVWMPSRFSGCGGPW